MNNYWWCFYSQKPPKSPINSGIVKLTHNKYTTNTHLKNKVKRSAFENAVRRFENFSCVGLVFCYLASDDMTNTNIEAELTGLLNKLTTEIEADQKQVDVLRKRIVNNQQLKHALQVRIGASNPADKSNAYGAKWDNVRNAIKAITKPRFIQSDVEAELKRIDPSAQIDRSRLRSTLWSLQAKKELIKQVRQGNNRQPAEFEKLPSSNGDLKGLDQGNDAMRRSVGIATNSCVITVGQLEDFIRKKNRRMKDVLVHFGVNESTVKKLFEPASRVFQAEKGWIKIRD